MNRRTRFPWKAVIAVLAVVAVLAVCAVSVHCTKKARLQRIEEELFLLPSQAFSADELEGLKTKLLGWSGEPISGAAKAVLYGRLSYIAGQQGDWLGYYMYFGREQYFLSASEDYDTQINSGCDILFYTYLAEGNLPLAQAEMDRIDAIIAEHGLEDPQLRSIVYRHHAALAFYAGDHGEAIRYAGLAAEVLTDPSASYYSTYLMGADMLRAKALAAEGEYAEAEALLEKHASSDPFTMTFYPSTRYNVCILPYRQVQAWVCAEKGDEAGMLSCVREILDKCIEYDYEFYGFDTLQRIDRRDRFSPETNAALTEMERDFNSRYNAQKADRYSSLCATVIDSNYEKARADEEDALSARNLLITLCALAVLILAFAGVVWLIVRKNRLDSLTGIGNRRSLDRTISRLELMRSDYSVIMLDIDDFKVINDTYGHAEGDRVLKEIGLILRALGKKGQIMPFRYGGEEFVVVTHGLLLGGSRELAELIRTDIEKQSVGGYPVTVSVGLAYSQKKDAKHRSQTLELADQMMYEAKASGKNCVVGKE